MNYLLGLDIGITSIGWAVVELNSEFEPCRIEALNSRIFTAAEHPQTGASLAAPRRESRGSRRRTRRRAHRKERIRQLIVNSCILCSDALDDLYNGAVPDVYETRVRALDEPVSAEDFSRLLIHYAQRRGFRSNRKTDKQSDEAGVLLTAIENNTAAMKAAGYRTVGEMLLKDPRFSFCKRNKQDNYINTVSRDMVEDEVRLIFEAQRGFGMPFASGDIESAYLDILLSQRSFSSGPACGPYSGNQVEKMIGQCTFEPDEKRAPKASYSFEYFSLLQQVNNMRYTINGEVFPLTEQQRESVIQLAHKKADVNFSAVRKTIAIPDDARFVGISYGSDDYEAVEKKTKLRALKNYHEMRKALDKISKGYIQNVPVDKRNAAAYALTVYKTDSEIRQKLGEAGFSGEETEALLTISGFSRFGHLSVKACDKLIPYLEKGIRYNEACELAGYDFRSHDGDARSLKLPANAEELHDITNPVVRRAVSQTIKVINAVTRDYGAPVRIHIELARDMSRDFNERQKVLKKNKANRTENDETLAFIKDELRHQLPTGQDLLKLKLWREQDGVCPYSLKPILLEKLFDAGYCDIDHIFPYSISFDDSFNNKVLVLSAENRQKGNRLPMEYLSGKKKDDFVVWVNTHVHNYRKRSLLLKPRISEDDLNGFRERNLNDTRYISRFMFNFINDHLQFADSPYKRKVVAVNGAVTSYMRKRWGIRKIREDGDLHHAVDAVVIACTTNGMIQRISSFSHDLEIKYMPSDDGSYAVNAVTGELLGKFPQPWHGFRDELEARVSDKADETIRRLAPVNYTEEQLSRVKAPFVSRMPCHKVTGAAHKETVFSPLHKGNNGETYVISKHPLTDLKLDRDGEIADYWAPDSDLLLYEALKKRLNEYNGDGKKAFAPGTPPMYKPKADGTDGPIVKKVKLTAKTNLCANIHNGNGTAANAEMVRVDVFYVENDGYYLVPIYVNDTVKDTLPNKAIVAYKPYEEWKEMDEKDFIFSLYPNDLIHVSFKSKKKFSKVNKDSTLPDTKELCEALVYYRGTGITVASIGIITHDNTYTIQSLGVKTLESLEKYEVDVLGNVRKAGRERREGFR